MPESESLLGRALNTVSGAAKKGVPRLQQIDGKTLPDFKVVRPHAGIGRHGRRQRAGRLVHRGFLVAEGGKVAAGERDQGLRWMLRRRR